MRVLIQRVKKASVSVDQAIVGRIGEGLLILVGFRAEDNEALLQPMAEKVANLRIFSDEKGRFNFSLLQTSGEILAVPQFTLYADTSRGRRPDFFDALNPADAQLLFDKFCSCLTRTGLKLVERGVFGAHMSVELQNDGPVTIMIEDHDTD